ncbi:MAG TPA: Bax inhibitor-1/YccA family protein [Abditibacteriaceae bacterium]|jgi:FtsH-binding integral membrane protein
MNPNSQPPNPFVTGTNTGMVSELSNEAQMSFIRKTYVLFMLGVFCCVAMGALTLMTPALTATSLSILKMPLLYIGIIFGASIGAQVLAQRPGLDVVALVGFTALLGFITAPIIAVFAPSVVGQAAMLSVVIFGSLTAYVLITKKDFNFLGGMLVVGMISLIAGSVLNALFFKNFNFSYFISWGVLLMSSGYVLYQTSNLVHEYRRNQAGAAALGLFISFFNIFMSLLNILGGSRD